MLDSLYIKNFRIFKELKIKALKRVNLFVGTNNTGKSCLLEGVYLYCTPDSIYNIIRERDEDWEVDHKEGVVAVDELRNPMRYMFHGYILPEVGDEENGIEIGALNNIEDRVTLTRHPFMRVNDEKGKTVLRELSSSEVDNFWDDVHIVYRYNYKLGDFINLREKLLFGSIPGPIRNVRRGKNDKMYVQRISSQNITGINISKLWDNINLTELEEEVVKALQIVEPRIIGVGMVGSESSGHIIQIRKVAQMVPIVRLEGSSERFPLRTFGDGVNRIFNIILTLVNAKDGIILIDEIENGLHWSIHPKLWEIVFSLSERLNIQVFATTHSLDCVRGFSSVWATSEDKASFYRLEKGSNNTVDAVDYDQETLSDSLETGIEFR